MFSILNMAINSSKGKIFYIFLIKNAHLLNIMPNKPIYMLGHPVDRPL